MPGWVRVNFNYFVGEEVFAHILEAVRLVAREGWKLLGDYRFDPVSGLWHHRAGPIEPPLQARRCRSSLLGPQPTVRRLASKGRGDLLSALRGPRKLRKPTSGSISTANFAWTRETICPATPEPSRTEITQTQTRGSRRRRAVTPAECTHGMLPRTSPISATSTAARSLPASSISPAVPSKGLTINTLSSLCMPGPVRRSRRTRV